MTLDDLVAALAALPAPAEMWRLLPREAVYLDPLSDTRVRLSAISADLETLADEAGRGRGGLAPLRL